jgi:hypothetical protein
MINLVKESELMDALDDYLTDIGDREDYGFSDCEPSIRPYLIDMIKGKSPQEGCVWDDFMEYVGGYEPGA